MFGEQAKRLWKLAVIATVLIPLAACNSELSPPPQPNPSVATGFEFQVDPVLETVTVTEVAQNEAELSQQYLPSDTRILAPGTDIEMRDFTFQFDPANNRLILRTRFENITENASFYQPLFFTLKAEQSGAFKRAVAPLVTDLQLGGDGVLSPGEHTHKLTFVVVHLDRPFSFFVDVSAVVFNKMDLVLRNDATGGDCTLAGRWYEGSKTCTLIQNLLGTIRINADGLSLDGNGHSLMGDGSGYGVYVPNRNGVTVRNLTAQDFSNGIRLQGGGSHTVEHNTFVDNVIGLHPFESSSNTLRRNTVSNNTYGIYLYGARSNESTIAFNLVDNNDIVGIQLTGAHDNVVTGNTVRNTKADGLNIWDFSHLTNAVNNVVTRNNFIGNGVQVQVRSGLPNSFSRAAPEGGNHWSDFDEPDEGCFDIDTNGFCDAPYVITGEVQDELPWTRRSGWSGP